MDAPDLRRYVEDFIAGNDGIEPRTDEECDGAQLQALKSNLDADIVPYADFSVWRPWGL
jgi:hypothetical protein